MIVLKILIAFLIVAFLIAGIEFIIKDFKNKSE